MKLMSDSLNRIAKIPAQKSNITNNFSSTSHDSSPPLHPYFCSTETPKTHTPTLSKNPKTLHVFWHEYEFEIGGRRAAKSFSRKEHGENRHVYSKRNIF